MRPHHYIKNLLLFFPLFYSGKIYEFHLLRLCIIVFIAFSLICSAVYIMNDYRDMDRDRCHPAKKNRPLASGKVSRRTALVLITLLLIIAIIMMLIADVNYRVIISVCTYILINIAYSFGGKNIPVLDIVLLGTGYPLRVIMGGYIVSVAVSEWMFLTILSVSFYLTLGKRCGELKCLDYCEKVHKTRPVLEYYTISYLEKYMCLNMGLGIVFYSLWAIEKNKYCVWTVPIVLVICMLYDLKLKEGRDECGISGDPVEIFVGSKSLIIMGLVYAVIMGVILYYI